MPINLVVIAAPPSSGLEEVYFAAYFSGVYTNAPAGDPIDFTATLNPDGSKRNPSSLPHVFPSTPPLVFGENGGDMSGGYIEIVKGSGLNNWAARFYQANGTELGTGAAYPAGAPASSAASSLLVNIGNLQGKF